MKIIHFDIRNPQMDIICNRKILISFSEMFSAVILLRYDPVQAQLLARCDKFLSSSDFQRMERWSHLTRRALSEDKMWDIALRSPRM